MAKREAKVGSVVVASSVAATGKARLHTKMLQATSPPISLFFIAIKLIE